MSNGFFENEHAIGVAEIASNVFPGVVGVGGADHYLDFGIVIEYFFGGLDSVPSGGHADVDKGDGEGAALVSARGREFEALLALVRGGQVKGAAFGLGRRLGVVEESGLKLNEPRVLSFGRLQDFFKVVMDRRVVVDDQDASAFGGVSFHGGFALLRRGGKR